MAKQSQGLVAKPSQDRNLKRHWVMLVLFVSVGLNLVLLLPGGTRSSRGSERASRGSPAGSNERVRYPLLASRVQVENPNEVIINFVPLRAALHEYAGLQNNSLGVFFQYLPTGISIGVNENQPFISASLLKLPTVMKAFKLIEEGRVNKGDLLELTSSVLDSGYGSLWKRGIGARITLEEALVHSLKASDNTAHRLLYWLTSGRPDDVYQYLDMTVSTIAGQTAVTPRNYTSILRSLYFSAYLSLPNSNELLSHLLDVEDSDVLRARIPARIPIAQKLGVHAISRESQHVFSFCGIFYVPLRPYTLCVMSETDVANAVRETQEISEMVYSFMSEYP